ncbi:MAG: PQQ-binding-like beta-propeller repeat protein, partial [Planctomycetaceae bacterium]|nr:PQQ-binding-like beta-propeller repeat protein [Planctomycetaceae bacterium]
LCACAAWNGYADDNAPPPNPLQRFFKEFDRGLRRGAEELEQAKKQRDQIDLRLFQDSEAERQLDNARELIARESWHDAIDSLQDLLARDEDAFLLPDDRQALSLRGLAEQEVAKLPDEGWRLYLTRFESEAQDQERRAIAESDINQLERLVRQYRWTSSGRNVTERLAAYHTDRGDFRTAIRVLLPSARFERTPKYRSECLQRIRHLHQISRDDRSWKDFCRDYGIEDTRTMGRNPIASLDSSPTPDTAKRPVSPYLATAGESVVHLEAEPMLFPLWTEDLIERYAASELIQNFHEAMRIEERALLPMRLPLVVRDKVVFRTLSALQFRNLADGGRRYEVRLEQSPEQRMTEPNDYGVVSREIQEYDQFASLLYRDGVYGSLSSDGRQLFTIEEQGTMNVEEPDRWGRDHSVAERSEAWSYNELVSYDLNSGRVLWRIGGPELEKEFSRPLAGTYFLGAPVARGGELYVIGEIAGEIRLIVLDQFTGEESWSQPLTVPGRPLSEDVLRRGWECQPVFTEGVAICPTTSGWIVAVDVVSRQLAWAYRISPRVPGLGRYREGDAVHSTRDLNVRWRDMGLCVAGHRVYVTPLEIPDESGFAEPVAVCLNATTGEELWKIPRMGLLYSVGANSQGLIAVGKDQVELRSRLTGGLIWSCSLPEPPSGRAARTENQLFVPCGHQLVEVNLADGQVERVSSLGSETARLGNLAFSENRLISFTNESISVFPAHQDFHPDSTERLAEAFAIHEIQRLKELGRIDEALEFLRDQFGGSTSVSQGFAESLENLEWDLLQLRAQMAGESAVADLELDRLAELAGDPSRRVELLRFRVDQAIRKDEWQTAVGILCESMLSEPSPQALVQSGSRHLRLNLKIGEIFASLWSQLDEEEQQLFEQTVRSRLFGTRLGAISDEWLAAAFHFHPLGHAAEMRMAERAWDENRFAEATLRLNRAARSSDAEIRATALTALADLMSRIGWHGEALEIQRQLHESSELSPAHEFTGTGDGVSVPSSTDAEASTDLFAASEGWEVNRTGLLDEESARYRVSPTSSVTPMWHQMDLLYNHTRWRLEFRERLSGVMKWSAPLQGLDELDHQFGLGVRVSGTSVFVSHGGIIQAFSFADRTLNWAHVPAIPISILSRYPTSRNRPESRMQPVRLVAAGPQADPTLNETGFLADVNECAVILSAQELVALDPLTGELLWKDEPISPSTGFSLMGDILLEIPTNGSVTVRSAFTGKTLADHPLKKISGRIVQLGEDSVAVLRSSKEGADQLELAALGRGGECLFSARIPATSLFAVVAQRLACWLEPSGELKGVDLSTRKLLTFGRIEPKLSRECRHHDLLLDEQRLYVLLDRGESQMSYVSMPSLPMTGTVVAFHRHGGELWRADVPTMKRVIQGDEQDTRWGLNLLTEEFVSNPLLLFAGDHADQREDLYFHQLQLFGIDKHTGKPVVDWKRPSESGGFSDLHVNYELRRIEINTYNDRITLSPHPRVAPGNGDVR